MEKGAVMDEEGRLMSATENMNGYSNKNSMITVNVDLGPRSYPVYIGSGLLVHQPGLLSRHVVGKQALIVTNNKIAPLFLDKTVNALKQGNPHISVETLILPDGEQFKNMESVMKVFDAAIEAKMDRRCTFVAVGGGVIGDICGYAAASYMRGVNYIHIPTTFMSQVDSSVEGKTGVNYRVGKNLIGAIHQPQAIETSCGYGNWLHGEAVAVGMVMAAEMSYRLGWIDGSIVKRLKNVLQRAKLPITPPPTMTVEMFKSGMAVDKKVADGMLRIVLLKGSLGSCVFTGNFEQKALHQTLLEFTDS
ncbi:UNVERIFIED_CONTAM: 3-dehydroquinate synthase, chloroplastic [Sesamum radiatum]|uniref:3-dehydroquinate synthase, chloroplastic n=1 Tax=Sesamum radiatum TaxID=300843 RepID=A0AAW2KXU9_SESRA